MIDRNSVEIKGTFLVMIRENTFNRTIVENVFEHINKFLEVVRPIKINEASQDWFRISIFFISLTGAACKWFKKDCIGSVTAWEDLVEKFIQKFYQLLNDNEEMEAEEDDNPDDINDIFKIEGNLFNYEIPLCKAFNDFNYLLKIDKDLFTFNIQGIRTYEEYELNNLVTWNLEEPCLDIDGFCNDGELPRMVRVGSMTYFQDHKCKATECWCKINAHEVTPFTRLESYGQRPYANIKTEKAHNPYLEVNNIFGRNYDTCNAQDNQVHEERRSVCKIKRFEMMKYSFTTDEECKTRMKNT
nr:hypothetical protein [Tanacetum cinerariifolium]